MTNPRPVPAPAENSFPEADVPRTSPAPLRTITCFTVLLPVVTVPAGVVAKMASSVVSSGIPEFRSQLLAVAQSRFVSPSQMKVAALADEIERPARQIATAVAWSFDVRVFFGFIFLLFGDCGVV